MEQGNAPERPRAAPNAAYPRLAGRTRELAALRAALADALTGRGGLALLAGEAGIGKTALAEAICAEASGQRALVLVGRCYDLAETPPYGPWIEAFARAPLGDDLPPLPAAVLPPERGGEAPGSQEAIIARARAYLRALAGRGPLVLFLDDLHWADPASLDLLRVLARDLPDAPLLVLAAYRAEEVGRAHPLYALLPVLVREARPARVDLRPLDPGALRDLVDARYRLAVAERERLAAYLRERAEGNPFYAVEVLRSLEEAGTLSPAGADWALGSLAAVGVPPLLRQVLDARIDRLGREARELLGVAAVLGQEVPIDLWLAVTAAGEGALLAAAERAGEAHLLGEAAGGAAVRFAHALVREVLYEGLSALRRRALHRRAAEALLATPAPDPDAVAYHLQHAGDPRAHDWLVRAGERAQGAFAFATATARFAAALAILEARAAPPGERGWLALRIASLGFYTDPRGTHAVLDRVEALAAEAGDDALAAHARFGRGALHCASGEIGAGLERLEAGVAALDRLGLLGDDHRGTFALWLVTVGRFAEGYRLAASLADDAPPRALMGAFPVDRFWALGIAEAGVGHPEAATAAFGRARALCRALGHDHFLGMTAALELNAVALRYTADRPAERRRLMDEAVAAFERSIGVSAGAPQVGRLQALPLEGAWGEALAIAQPAARIGQGLDLIAGLVIGGLAREIGLADVARFMIGTVLPDGPATPFGRGIFFVEYLLNAAAARLALDDGDLPRARAWLEAADRRLAWSGAILYLAEQDLAWVAYHRAAGDAAAALRRAVVARDHAAAPRQPLVQLAAERALGELATDAGRFADAARHLDAAFALAEACVAPAEHAHTTLALAELRAATGDAAGAAAALDEARGRYLGFGAIPGQAPALRRADALAARLDAAPPPARPAGLTAREAEVLRLIVAGGSNREIAAALSISERTVGRHIENLYRKIDAKSKAEATAWAFRYGLA